MVFGFFLVLLSGGPVSVVEAACLENRRSQVRTPVWHSSLKCSFPFTRARILNPVSAEQGVCAPRVNLSHDCLEIKKYKVYQQLVNAYFIAMYNALI